MGQAFLNHAHLHRALISGPPCLGPLTALSVLLLFSQALLQMVYNSCSSSVAMAWSSSLLGLGGEGPHWGPLCLYSLPNLSQKIAATFTYPPSSMITPSNALKTGKSKQSNVKRLAAPITDPCNFPPKHAISSCCH